MDVRDSYDWTAAALRALRSELNELGFNEILPALLSARPEPGARHTVAVQGRRALPTVVTQPEHDVATQVRVEGEKYFFLPVSHAVEKQLSLEHQERVYCMAPCTRLLMEGEDTSGRHLVSFFQLEIELRTESVDEVFGVGESLLAGFSRRLLLDPAAQRLLTLVSRDRLSCLQMVPYPRLRFEQARARAQAALEIASSAANPHSVNDLTHKEEEALGRSFTTPYWIHSYPEGVRDSLYRRNPLGFYDTYDLMLPGNFGELSTGGLRPDSYAEIVRQSGIVGSGFNADYARWKQQTGVQTGGFGIGIERLLRFVSGAESVLDFRRYHDSGPNATIVSSGRS